MQIHKTVRQMNGWENEQLDNGRGGQQKIGQLDSRTLDNWTDGQQKIKEYIRLLDRWMVVKMNKWTIGEMDTI